MLKIGIIGSGPSGLYAIDSLVKSSLPNPFVIDVFERLPTPYGLLRGGVAPDHLKIKNLESFFEKILTHPFVRFFGNVTVGQTISVEVLKAHYHALIFCYGAEGHQSLNVPCEDLKGCWSSKHFVGFYNSHPDDEGLDIDLSGQDAVIIGQGNVALDVARVLAKSDKERQQSDMHSYPLSVFSKSRIRTIHLVGRRGPVYMACTDHELEELTQLSDCQLKVCPEDLILNAEDEHYLNSNTKAQKNMSILRKAIKQPSVKASKTIVFHFNLSLRKILGKTHVNKLIFTNQKTQKQHDLPCQLLIKSVGYKGLKMPGLAFDEEKGIVPNQHGKVEEGIYVAGWIKRGANGVIGMNKKCSQETVDTLIASLSNVSPISMDIVSFLKEQSIRYVTFDEWQNINEYEKKKGISLGKPREKCSKITQMLSLLNP